jgi:23S rRNA (adenine1618-N6)-methyltransferase
MPSKPASTQKANLHPRNRHRGAYDFPLLVKLCPALAPYVSRNEYGNLSVDFKNPDGVKNLNKALLIATYGIKHWDIPEGYLCPPIPGRADYIHYLADLLARSNKGVIPRGAAVKGLDIGTGANCIYPLLGHSEYGWSFTGTDIDDMAINSAQSIIDSNNLTGSIELRKQPSKLHIFTDIIQPGERFDFTMCNPPFHSSVQEAAAGNERKWKNLGVKKGDKKLLNFGGRNSELVYPGGEERFLRRMITESAELATTCKWFTSLVSKKETLESCYRLLEKVKAVKVKTIDMAQGQKTSRILAWTFMGPAEKIR